MRVIGGTYRGHKLHGFKADHIRPITDRVKETLFNILGPMHGYRCLDLFCGTGSIGIEAISRGAEYVQFVDSSFKSLEITKKNLQIIREKNTFKVIKSDVFKHLKSTGGPYDIVFLDPPFPKMFGVELLRALHFSDCLQLGSKVVLESSIKEPLDFMTDYNIGAGPILTMEREKIFGDKRLTIWSLGEQ